MIGIGRKSLNRFGVAAQLVGHHDPGLAVLRVQRANETPGRLGISARLNQDVENASISINRPPEPVFHAANDDHDFVQMLVTRAFRKRQLG